MKETGKHIIEGIAIGLIMLGGWAIPMWLMWPPY